MIHVVSEQGALPQCVVQSSGPSSSSMVSCTSFPCEVGEGVINASALWRSMCLAAAGDAFGLEPACHTMPAVLPTVLITLFQGCAVFIPQPAFPTSRVSFQAHAAPLFFSSIPQQLGNLLSWPFTLGIVTSQETGWLNQGGFPLPPSPLSFSCE